MTAKTLKQLRELAKKAGIKGYSKLPKQDLEAALAKPARSKTAAGPKNVVTKKPAKPSAPKTAPPTSAHAPTPVDPDRVWWQSPAATARLAPDTEEKIESAKYALSPTGADTAATVAVTDLGEDIDHLPPLRQSTLALLPQKPGVLHAYWTLTAGDVSDQPLQLRLCRVGNGSLEVCQEAVVPAPRGQWYFHVPESLANHEVVVQLGYYRGNEFVSAANRGVARIPSLYASARTDRWWWISEADFRRMYLRAGGATRGRGLQWTGSIGSPSGRAQADDQLGWPGGVSSSR